MGDDEMIVKKYWAKRTPTGRILYEYEGYFLLGFIPLYIYRNGLK